MAASSSRESRNGTVKVPLTDLSLDRLRGKAFSATWSPRARLARDGDFTRAATSACCEAGDPPRHAQPEPRGQAVVEDDGQVAVTDREEAGEEQRERIRQ